jgi:hypothetical protein
MCDFLMADLKEQHICIKFCFKLEKLHPETKPGFTVMIQQQITVLLVEMPVLSTSNKHKANQVKHQQHVGNHF